MTEQSITDAFMPLRRAGLDPLPELAAVRAATPVTKLEFPFGISAWLVTGYQESRAVLGDHGGFSNDFANVTAVTGGMATADQDPGGLGMADPPKHTRLRKMLTPEFTMRRLRRLLPRIEQIVNNLLDDMERAGQSGQPVDLVQAFAMPLPSLVICELLDVPYPDREQFQRLSGSRFDIFGGAGTGLEAISESLSYMRELVDAQRKNPGDGLLGMLIRTYGDDITDEELAGLADGVLIGGHETTASTLALGALLLLTNPQYADLVRRAGAKAGDAAVVADAVGADGATDAGSNAGDGASGVDSVTDDGATGEDAIHRVVEELLRYLTVVQMAFPRFARTDVEVAGQHIKAGEMVLCSLSAADRDPALAAGDLEAFDPRRAPTQHLAFGYGIHRCVGSELARMELRLAYPMLLRRFPNLRLAVPAADLTFREYSIVYAVEELPVTW
jgi:cytochrome P450